MNTDVILDFFVNYYIWFIIGGAILLLAIIGFIADKKKLFIKKENVTGSEFDDNKVPSNSESIVQKNEQYNDELSEQENLNTNNTLEENESLNKNDFLEDNNSLENNEFGETGIIYEDENKSNEFERSIQENDFSEKNSSDVSLEKIANPTLEEENIVQNNIQVDNINYIHPINVENNQIDDKLFNQNETLSKDSNIYLNKSTESETLLKDSNTYIDKSTEKENNTIMNIDDDINKINNMVFDNDEEKEIPSEELEKSEIKQNIDENKYNFAEMTGDNTEKTVQVNYSQLKEMVEDIIAETQKENQPQHVESIPNDVTEPISVLDVMNKNEEEIQGIQDIPLPNLNNIAVDAIRQQDEDEDDVWKF